MMNAILQLELRKSIQDRGLLFWTLILPIIFTVLFISIFTSGAEPATKEQIITSIVPGYIVMFVFFNMISMVGSFLKDQESGMITRIFSTPLAPSSYLFGKWVPYMYIVLTQIFILLVFGKLVYDIPLNQPLYILILSIFLTLTVTGIGLGLSLIVKTFNMGLAMTQIFALGGALLGGLWIPIDLMPPFFSSISRILPQYWAHQAFQEAMTGTLTFSEFVIALLILLGFGLIGFMIALLSFKTFLKRARS